MDLRTKIKSDLKNCYNFNECFDKLYSIVISLGFTQIVYARQNVKPKIDEKNWYPLKLNVRNFPNGWDKQWKHFESHDPYYHACFNSTLPFSWKKVQKSNLYSEEKQAWKYLADFGLSNGMTIPMHSPNGKFAVISVILNKDKINWSEIYQNNYKKMFIISHVFNEFINQKGFVDQAKITNFQLLSPREIECLKWASLGKTSPEIAVILERSVDTVRLHIKNSMLKLNSSTRTHAVAKAVGMGIINFD